DLFRIFLGLDLDKAARQWLLHRPSKVIEGFDLFSVHLGNGEVSEFIVANGAVSGQHLAENHDTPVSVREEFRLEPIEVNEPLRRFSLPVRSPFFEVLPRQFLEDEPAKNVVSWRFIEAVGWTDVIPGVAMIDSHV